MAYQIPIGEPLTLTPGTTWTWTKSLADFPRSEGWTLTYYLVGPHSISFAAGADPNSADGYLVTVAALDTALVTEGTYTWVARVSLAGAVYDAAQGTFDVLANPDVQAGTDASSHAVRVLAKIEAEIEARITGTGTTNDSYSIDGRSFNRMSLADLYRLRARYLNEVETEANGGSFPATVVHFGRTRTGSTSARGWWAS